VWRDRLVCGWIDGSGVVSTFILPVWIDLVDVLDGLVVCMDGLVVCMDGLVAWMDGLVAWMDSLVG